MADTDISLVDKTVNYSRTYYGNGCDGEWADIPPYYGGSPTSCSTNIVPADSGQDQKIGTYYSYNAGSAGTGDSSMTTQNSNTPDTFCPLGWQLPYSGTGGDYYDKSKSWKYLFRQYGYDFGNNQQTWRDFTMKYPMSYIDSGRFNFRTAMIGQASNSGYYWSETVKLNTLAYNMALYASSISQSTYGKNDSLALRCIFAFHRRHGGRNASRSNSIYRY